MRNAASFGRTILHANDTTTYLDLERQAGKHDAFQAVDALLSEVLLQCLRGMQMVTTHPMEERTHGVHVAISDTAQRAILDEIFALAAQQARGAWFLPEIVSVRTGWINLPYYVQQHAQFATGMAREDRGRVKLATSADAVLTWALIEPLANQLFLPFELRGALVGSKPPHELAPRWDAADAFLKALGFCVDDELAVLRPGHGWSKLRAAAQHATKVRLLDRLAEQATSDMAMRYRASCLIAFTRQYYKKATPDGCAKRTAVITKAFERPFAGFFGGAWLQVLAYLDEVPHPDEQVVTTLPRTRLYVGHTQRAEALAEQQGIPVAEVERMLAAFWNQTTSISPVERRVTTLQTYWAAFDTVHTQHTVENGSLWGLVEDRTAASIHVDPNTPEVYHAGLYRHLLPAAIVQDVDALWGSTMLPCAPERQVSEPYPHAAMAEAFGIALRFWHGCALTAWFVCEGPYSRTDIAGMKHYYRREIAGLADHHTPIDGQLFDELQTAAQRLGPPQPRSIDSSTGTTEDGISITTSISMGTRRDGFEHLRDVISRYRKRWAEQYLEIYLRARWEMELQATARAFAIFVSDKGKVPTIKQGATFAEDAINHWFGGDLSACYGAIGEKAPVQTTHHREMPANRQHFVSTLFTSLGGRDLGPRPPALPIKRYHASTEALQQQWGRARLAEAGLHYIQLSEALGRAPALGEFGGSTIDRWLETLDADIDVAWNIYAQAVARVSQQPARAAPLCTAAASEHFPQASSAGETPLATAVPSIDTEAQPSHASTVIPVQACDHSAQPVPAPTIAVSAHRAWHSPDDDAHAIKPPTPKRSWVDRLLGRNK